MECSIVAFQREPPILDRAALPIRAACCNSLSKTRNVDLPITVAIFARHSPNGRYHCLLLQMSHLYKIFSKQVASYCTESPLPDCNKNMLVSGIRSLASMDDNQLDRMDPYQRGANDISKFRYNHCPTGNPCVFIQARETRDFHRVCSLLLERSADRYHTK